MTHPTESGFATRAIHAGYDPMDHGGSLVPPIHMTSTFAFPDMAEGAARFGGTSDGYVYTRIANPTLALLETRLASLEEGAAALATASGMGAITAALWTLLSPGDRVVVDRTLYGCTFAFLRHGLAKFGVEIVHADLTATDPAALAAAIPAGTKLVYFETPANPNMRIVDIAAIAARARAVGALTMVDNTYATPALQRPLTLGADLVVHSATKYLGGHGDVVAGAVIGRDPETIRQIRLVGLKDMTGAVLSPMDAFLVMRGLKTLELRMERHSGTAARVAERLAGDAAVSSVRYPGLQSDPGHAIAARQMTAFGGMIAFELVGGHAAGLAFMDALQVVTRAVSLGDAESLVQHPASMTHSTYTAAERAEFGIADGLVRLSIGLETPDDLLRDIDRGLAAAAMAVRKAA